MVIKHIHIITFVLCCSFVVPLLTFYVPLPHLTHIRHFIRRGIKRTYSTIIGRYVYKAYIRRGYKAYTYY